jgi:hypothetical protein
MTSSFNMLQIYSTDCLPVYHGALELEALYLHDKQTHKVTINAINNKYVHDFT